MMELLQEKNKGKVIICNCGNFYVATGKDAIILHKELNLKLSCFKSEVCKIGFPISSLEKYTDMIEERKYSYVLNCSYLAMERKNGKEANKLKI